MLSRYSHVRMESRRRALDEIAVRQTRNGRRMLNGSSAPA